MELSATKGVGKMGEVVVVFFGSQFAQGVIPKKHFSAGQLRV